MTIQSTEIVGRHDPNGSIFLPENQSEMPASNLPQTIPVTKGPDGSLFLPNEDLLKKYLSFRYPPENVLGMLYAQASPDELPALLEVLDVRWRMMRGGYEPIDPEIDPLEDSEKFDAEMAKRLRYREVLMDFQQTHALIMMRTVGRVAVTD